ncbi:lysozyme M1 (1,4-beta-N-acetylmuramidase) [Slackia heliotrinireducens DSM 20476]|uniref:Lysozyme M1 (1,4-beta-N-acetylmuramidase) n=1 Tax=Slackia heliotrinireducens (strain ATCC 29202 / DSM 20476 / NCTC 11029 / RHS 1) TaxID=471855 RepID=C7N1U2_SLAHD|nr:lysozyme M1 (1,4-beta-N-acetylmuramidase) [Slackia heliotrinireducens DSM 20476]
MRIAAVVLLLVVFAVGGGIAGFLASDQGASGEHRFTESLGEGVDAQIEPIYDWGNLRMTEDGRRVYEMNGEVVSRQGIDVSAHQEHIDWSAVVDDGIDFAMIRLGYRSVDEGNVALDDYYAYNLEQAQASGLDVGVYFFSAAVTVEEAVEEAQFCIENLQAQDAHLQYPVVFDLEMSYGGRVEGLTRDELTAIAQAFCTTVEEAGYQAMVYGNASDMLCFNLGDLSAYPRWHAEYTPSPAYAYYDFVMWQYTDSGQVAGIVGNVDLDLDLSAARPEGR